MFPSSGLDKASRAQAAQPTSPEGVGQTARSTTPNSKE